VKRIIRTLMGVLDKDVDEDDTLAYSAEEVGARRPRREKHKEGQEPRNLTVEMAAEVIDELPSDIPQESAARIVRGALAAVGIGVSNLDRITQARGTKLRSEIELAQNRQKEFREKIDQRVRALEEQIKKAREDYDTVLAEEEKNLSRASAALKEVKRVRAFFDFPEIDEEESIAPTTQDSQPLHVGGTQEGRCSGPSAATDYKVSVELKSLARTSCESLPAIEVDEFDEFIARIRGERRHAQEVPQPTDERSGAP
jgi:hypothetical protein